MAWFIWCCRADQARQPPLGALQSVGREGEEPAGEVEAHPPLPSDLDGLEFPASGGADDGLGADAELPGSFLRSYVVHEPTVRYRLGTRDTGVGRDTRA